MTRMGIVIGGGWIQAALWRGGGVAWAAEHPLDSVDDLEEALALLAAARPPGRTTVRVALSHDLCQTRLLPSLAAVGRARLERVADLNAARWFPVRSGQAVVAAFRQGRGAPAVALQADSGTLDAVWSGCAAAGLEVRDVTALPLVLAAGRHDGTIAWTDGAVTVDARAGRGFLLGLRRRAVAPAGGGYSPADLPGLAGLDARTAVAAATARWSNGRCLVPPGRLTERSMVERQWTRRLMAAGGVLWLVAGAVLTARAAAVNRDAREAEQAIEADAPLAAARATVRIIDALTAELAQRAAQRSSDGALLARVMASLPESTTVSRFQRDSAGVLLEGLAPGAGRVVTALLDAGFAGVRAIGRAERAPNGPVWAERFTVQIAAGTQ